ncbi:peptidoglycan bridge formation glycyltransferase FemA/FemB family protein [Bacteroidales bacterium OttesenSCG-928-A17]|nr:peptidoglycan bridge formation glycyltransferase FemA/FemB family protein [Bacteroidales bacterium OttesenSCG-928-A17]
MVEIIPLSEKKKWDELIHSMLFFDFYHLNEYHRLDTTGESLLFHYKDAQISIAFPLILREIIGTEYYDVSSVYGYPGPLSDCAVFQPESIRSFQEELRSFFDSKRVVSAFSRLHPLFPAQLGILSGLNKIEKSGFTVSIDLLLPESSQRAAYSHSLSYDIRKAIKQGVVLRNAETDADIASFASIYRETMERVNARPYYFFPDEYFLHFVKTINSNILLAVYQDQIIAGTLYTEYNGIIQIHLSATKTDFLKWSPTKYVWDQIREEGCRKKMQILHLGGGAHSREDGISYFKTLFSKRKSDFNTWRYIHNKEVYEQLVGEKSGDTSFFPLYRM